MTGKVVTLPKFYVYTVDGIKDEEGNPKRFSIASLSRDLEDEFDLEGIAFSAAQDFFLSDEKYKSPDIWPLAFKFIGSNSTKTMEIFLDFAPTFSSKEKSKPPVKRRRRTKEEIENENSSTK